MTARDPRRALDLADGADLAKAVERLADVLERENAALAAIDLLAAARFTAEKQSAADAFIRASAARNHAAEPPPHHLGARIAELAETNRHLLAQAIVVQGRVIQSFARAAPRMGPAPRYGSTGTATATRTAPVALIARA